MRMLAAIALVTVASFSAVSTSSQPAHADERAPLAPVASTFALELSGVRFGPVRALEASEPSSPCRKTLLLATQDVAPPLATLLDAFLQRKPLKRDVRLTSGAVMRKANDARLVSMKLPALGSGGSADVELAFVVPALTTQPLLSAKEAPPPPASAHIASFRIDLSGMQAFEAPKLDAITLTQDSDFVVTTGEIAIEVAAGGAPPFVAWQRAGRTPRSLRIEYVAADGRTLLKLALDRCTPTAVKPLGASGTTRITLACAPLGG